MRFSDIGNWLLFTFFVVGALGGITYFVRLMFYKEARTEVRYVQVPVYYGYDPGWQPVNEGLRPGDMAQATEGDTKPAA